MYIIVAALEISVDAAQNWMASFSAKEEQRTTLTLFSVFSRYSWLSLAKTLEKSSGTSQLATREQHTSSAVASHQ